MTDFVVVIPARYASSRLPGKPLLDIGGKTMIQRVYEQALASSARHVIIATDDQRIYDHANGFGAQVCMTKVEHESGTDRLEEVARHYRFNDDDIVVNVQGDEPLIPPEVIDQVASLLGSNPQADIATLCEPLLDIETLFDPNVVKVVRDMKGRALYFSRAPVPWAREGFADVEKRLPEVGIYRRHIGIYAYRVALLHRFVTWPPTPLESLEKLEQLRAMENGTAIMVDDAIAQVPGGIDTPADLDRVRRYLGV